MPRPILCLDFDGVCHSYTSGWKGADVIPDPPVEGMWDFLREAQREFEVHIFSSRSNQTGGRNAMIWWFSDNARDDDDKAVARALQFPLEKPAAMVSIDDRCFMFSGVWPSIATLKGFEPWNKKKPSEHAIELYKQDGSPTGVYYCSQCRAVFPSKIQAEHCHGPRVCECGKEARRYSSTCTECQSKQFAEREAARERERFEKATKIAEAEYKGDMVYAGDDYYESVDDALEGYIDGQQPEYVWACKDVGVPLADIDGIVEHLLEEMWDDADVNDLNGIEELEEAVKRFNEANKAIHVYHPDYSTAILVAPRKPEEV